MTIDEMKRLLDEAREKEGQTRALAYQASVDRQRLELMVLERTGHGADIQARWLRALLSPVYDAAVCDQLYAEMYPRAHLEHAARLAAIKVRIPGEEP